MRCDICGRRRLTKWRQANVNNMPLVVCADRSKCDARRTSAVGGAGTGTGAGAAVVVVAEDSTLTGPVRRPPQGTVGPDLGAVSRATNRPRAFPRFFHFPFFVFPRFFHFS